MLDASTRIDVLNLLGDLKARGVGILFITHDLSLGNYISDKTLILRRGRIAEYGRDAEGVRQSAAIPTRGRSSPRCRSCTASGTTTAGEPARSVAPLAGATASHGRTASSRSRKAISSLSTQERRPPVSRVASAALHRRDECAATSRRTRGDGASWASMASSSTTCTASSRMPSGRLLDAARARGVWPACGASPDRERARTTCARARALGTDRLVVNWIEPPAQRQRRRGDVRTGFACWGSARAALGLRLGFHNHAGELRRLDDGRSFLDHLLRAGGSTLFLELDLGWVWYAGATRSRCSSEQARAPRSSTSRTCARDDGPVLVPLGEGCCRLRPARAGGRARRRRVVDRRAGRDRRAGIRRRRQSLGLPSSSEHPRRRGRRA